MRESRYVCMTEEELEAYRERQGQSIPWKIRQYMPDRPPVLTPEELAFAREVARAIDD